MKRATLQINFQKFEQFCNKNSYQILIFSFLFLLLILSPLKGDYDYYYGGWKFIAENDHPRILMPNVTVQTVWPPTFQFFSYYLLGSLNYWGGKFLFANLMILSFFSILKITNDSLKPMGLKNIHLLIALIISYRFFMGELKLFQGNLITMALASVGLFLIDRKKTLGSFLIAFSFHIKVISFLFIPWMIYKRLWKEVILVLSFTVLITAVPLLLWPREIYFEMWNLFFEQSTPLFFPDGGGAVHSLGSLIRSIFTKQPDHIGWFDLKLAHIELIIFVSYSVAALMALKNYSFKSWNNTTSYERFIELSTTFLMVLIVSPVARKAQLVLLVPTIIYMVYVWFVFKVSIPLKILSLGFLLFGTFSSQSILGKDLWEKSLMFHFPTIAILCLFLFHLLAPKRSKE